MIGVAQLDFLHGFSGTNDEDDVSLFQLIKYISILLEIICVVLSENMYSSPTEGIFQLSFIH